MMHGTIDEGGNGFRFWAQNSVTLGGVNCQTLIVQSVNSQFINHVTQTPYEDVN